MNFKRFTSFAAFLFALVGAGIFVAHPAFAQVDLPALETFAKGAGFATGYTIPEMITRIIRTFLGFLGIVLVCLILYAGFLYMTSGGNPERVKKAKNILSQAIVGLIIVLSSFTITQFILGKLGDVLGPEGTACSGLSGAALTCCTNPSATGCGGCWGSTCSQIPSFHLLSTNTIQCAEQGIRNLAPNFIFSRALDANSVSSGGIVIKQHGGDVIPGTFVTTGTTTTFTPTATCDTPNTSEHCFLANTTYDWSFDKTILKDTATSDELRCDLNNIDYLCFGSFTTGTGVDITPPTVSMVVPTGSAPVVGDIKQLQAKTVDDTGVSNVNFFEVGIATPFYSAGLNQAVNNADPSVPHVLMAAPLANIFSTDPTIAWNTVGHLVAPNMYQLHAQGSDCAGHTTTSADIPLIINPAHCANGVQDAGETGTCTNGAPCDCGGDKIALGAEYCGACVPSPCTKNADCASGWCEAGFCVDRPRIDLISPDNAAPGSLVTISGTGFGTSGTIRFIGKAVTTDDQVVAPYTCGTTVQWTNTQIVVQVPTGAVDGPVMVQLTSNNRTDATNDDFGYLLADFDVNAIKRPGLCSVAPTTDKPGTVATFSGLQFPVPQGSASVYFKDFSSAGYPAPAWTATSATSIVPNMSAQPLKTRMFVGDFQCINATGSKIAGVCATDADCGAGNTCAKSWCSEQTYTYCSPTVACPANAGTCGSVRIASNELNFTVQDPDAVTTAPHISYVDSGWKACKSTDATVNGKHCATKDQCGTGGTCEPAPNWGPIGQYVTIFGTNFGTAKGIVEFGNGLKTAIGKDNFPTQCGTDSWHDTFITIKVPETDTLSGALAAGNYKITVKRQDYSSGKESNAVDFSVLTDLPGPSICLLDPSTAPAKTTGVKIYGENLGPYTSKGSVTYFSNQAATFSSWSNTLLDDGTVPDLAATGPVIVANSAGFTSNPLLFTVGSCKTTPSICSAGKVCCADGGCYDKCPASPPASHFAYRVSTGTIPDAPSVIVACDADYVSPSPWNDWQKDPNAKAVCLNVNVTASFMNVDKSTLTTDTIKLDHCTAPLAKDGSCSEWISDDISGKLQVFADSFKIQGSGSYWLAVSTPYRVTIKGGALGIKSFPVGNSPATPMASDYSWQFTTGAVGDLCLMGGVNVSPSNWTATAKDQPIDYQAQPIAQTNKCLVLSCAGYSVAWNSDTPSATIPTKSATNDECTNTATAVSETNVGVPANIQATISDPIGSKSDVGKLTIDFTNPSVVAFSPPTTCSTACINIQPWVRFSAELATVTTNQVEMKECADALCAKNELIGDSVLNSVGSTDLDTITLLYNGELKKDTWYRIVLSGTGIKSKSGVALKDSGSNYGSDQNTEFPGDFSWKFKTKNSDISCKISTLTVSPQTKTLSKVGARQEYHATAYSAPDACDASGEALQNAKYTWKSWTAADNPNNFTSSNDPTHDVADVWAAGAIQLSPDLPKWCSSICLNTGAIVKKGDSVCGNNIKEKGEACDDNNTTNGDGCSLNCLLEGSTSSAVCGDGVIGKGESCDDGNKINGDGCSSKCLNEGSSAAKVTCGDKLDYAPQKGGEDCDDGNKVNGDGCSSNCLDEGSVTKGTYFATCGDGTIDKAHGEQCDDSNTVSGDGCSSICLNEGVTKQCTSLCSDGSKAGQNCKVSADCGVGGTCNTANTPCCGDGNATEKGKSCDDGNTISGDGCSSSCLNEGSSSQYPVPSFCGDGNIQTGEECDATAPYTTSGYGMAFITDNASHEVVNGYAVSKITAEADGAKGDATLQVQCSCKNDQSCNATGVTTLGCGTGSCCFDRPHIVYSSFQPAAGYGPQGKGYCRNTAIWFDFDKTMDPKSFEAVDQNKDGTISQDELGNIRLQLFGKVGHCSATTTQSCFTNASCVIQGQPTGQTCVGVQIVGGNQTLCPASYTLASADQKSSSNILVKAWQWAKKQFALLLGLPVYATPDYCLAPVTFKTVQAPTLALPKKQRVLLEYPQVLEPNALYVISILGDNNLTDAIPKGVLSMDQVGLQNSYSHGFLTGSEVCLLDSVSVTDLGKVDPVKKVYEPDSFNFFSKKGETHNFQSQALTYRAGLGTYEPIQSTNSYSWDWQWGSSAADATPPATPVATDIVDLKSGQTPPALTDKAKYSSTGNNGSEQIVATATITTDTINTPTTKGTNKGQRKGTREITALNCERPWPALDSTDPTFPYVEPASQFGFYYCLDRGVEGPNDDLPPLKKPVDVTSAASAGLFQELLFQVEGTSDAIGVRVIQNPNYLSPKAWFQSQPTFVNASFSEIKMDGYEGVQSGNTAYVAATNQQGGFLYPNIYVVSYNPTAGADAKAIFEQILKNWRFNANTDVVTNVGLCQIGNVYAQDKDSHFIPCQWDGDCVETLDKDGGECEVSKMQPSASDLCPLYKTAHAFCDSDKAKIQKDMKRLTDITTTVSALTSYGNKNKHCSVTKGQSCSADPECPGTEKCVKSYPSVLKGTFVPAMSVSTWDSWNAALSNDLQTKIATDPLNQYFLSCKDQGPNYDPVTCFNGKEGKYVCPTGSHVYGYQNVGGEKFTLYSQLEYTGAPWKYPIDQFSNDDATINAEYDGDPTKLGPITKTVAGVVYPLSGFKNNQGLCAESTIWGTSNLCGDGVKGLNEDCEIGQVKSIACTDATGKAGLMNVTCVAPSCKYQTESQAKTAGAVCVSYACGNGIKEGTEICDDGGDNGKYGHCGLDCTFAKSFLCGDGSLSGNEQCDCGDNTFDITASKNANSWAAIPANKNGMCRVSNGQYGAVTSNGVTTYFPSCSYDCKVPGPSCGDKQVNGSEQCDGGSETYAGALCSDGLTKCTKDSDCSSGSCTLNSPSSLYNACGKGKICVGGSYAGDKCVGDANCNDPGVTTGKCSAFDYDLTRTRVCSDSCTWPAWSACQGGAQVCGNGAKEGTEECDDGNQSNNDSCTTECKKNICGDGNVFTGIEACDSGIDNKLPNATNLCGALYGGSCNYCNTLCQYKTLSGAYCGDGIMNGTEFCDGDDMPYICLKVTGSTVETGKSCAKSDAGKTGGTVCDDGFTCQFPAVCNGGSDNGKSCTVSGVSGTNSYTCATGGTCVSAVCSKDCSGSCPLAYKTASLLVTSQQEGSQPLSSIELYSYLNTEKATPVSAKLNFPACRVGTTLTANVDDTKVIPPAVDVVFVTDLTQSMTKPIVSGQSSKIQIVSDAMSDAINTLYGAYSTQKGAGKMRIGLVSFGGTTVPWPPIPGKDSVYVGCENSACIDSSLVADVDTNALKLKTIAHEYPLHSGGASNPQGIIEAKKMLAAEPSDHIKILIFLSDGQSIKAIDGTDCSSKVNLTINTESGAHSFSHEDYCTAEVRYNVLKQPPDLFYYSAVISTDATQQAYMEHLSSMKCTGASMSTLDDCTEGNYAFNANSPVEIKKMYDEIIQTILNATTTVGGSSGTGITPTGNNVTLQLPSEFTCQDKPFSMPLTTNFYGTGTMKFDNFSFSYCPTE